ncbi:MAG: STAS/SEC14 domain-containing protein [Sphingobacteriia bacterium]|nr:STAS/SEC14 domain-containing protein [Sphingobacteriia bacterium]
MQQPANKQIIEGEIADYYFDDSGILVSLSKNVLRTVENIGNNVELVKQITKNKKVPLLIYLTKSPVPDKATQKFSAEQLPIVYTAMAMVSKPGLTSFIMKLLFRFKQPPIPMKGFTNEAEAKEWLLQYL